MYGRPLATMPDVLMIDIPPHHFSPSLPLERYYPVIIETDAEYAEMEAFLAMDRLRAVAPDLLDRRCSALIGDDVVIARYTPPCPGWPWLMLCRWPPDYAAMVPEKDNSFARGNYTSEVFYELEEIVEAEARLIETLGTDRTVRLLATPQILGSA